MKKQKADGLTASAVVAALMETNGSPSEAAKVLGVSRSAIYYQMRKHNIIVSRLAAVSQPEEVAS